MKIAISSDHAGFELKTEILHFLKNKNFNILDLGPFYNNKVDYPDLGAKVALLVSQKEVDLGIVLCGTGIGMTIVANKFKNVRAAVIYDEYTAKMAREHNDVNVIALGGRILTFDLAKKNIEAFLSAKFQNSRHKNRIDKISKIEDKNFK